jgi:hypothetical protein
VEVFKPEFSETMTLQVDGHGCLLYYQPRNTDTTPSIQIGSGFFPLVINSLIFICAVYLHPLYFQEKVYGLHELHVGAGTLTVVAKQDAEGESSGFVVFTTLICNTGTNLMNDLCNIS